jgi:hypothetical protein
MILTTSSPRSLAPRTAAPVRRSPTRKCALVRTGVRPRPVARASFGGCSSRQPVAPAPGGGARQHSRASGGVRPAAASRRSRCRALLRDSILVLSTGGSARVLAIMPRYRPQHEPVGSKAPAAHRNAGPRWLECCTSDIEPPFRQLTLDEVRLNEESIAFAIP